MFATAFYAHGDSFALDGAETITCILLKINLILFLIAQLGFFSL
jgi:hypothetical protein